MDKMDRFLHTRKRRYVLIIHSGAVKRCPCDPAVHYIKCDIGAILGELQ